LNNDAATRNSITPDGWFKTGDVAVIDSDGFYWIVDRKKELIKYKVCTSPAAIVIPTDPAFLGLPRSVHVSERNKLGA
jgi:acyl-CoA synthetase (AMP-forming)/AMP-acid ligase II